MAPFMGTSVKRSTSLKQIVDRAEGYDIPGEIVDGMNFREVRDKVGEVADSIRKESHPAFLEVRTYRYRGHSMITRNPRADAPVCFFTWSTVFGPASNESKTLLFTAALMINGGA